MDCRGDELIQHNNRTAAQAVPFQYLINEQAKSILALQVGVLQFFFFVFFSLATNVLHKTCFKIDNYHLVIIAICRYIKQLIIKKI